MSWPTVSSPVMAVARRCVAFPCDPSLLPSALAAVQTVGSVKHVYHWREKGYCLCELQRPAFLLPLMGKAMMQKWVTQQGDLPIFSLLNGTPRIASGTAAVRCKTTTMTELPSPDAVAQKLAQFKSLSAQILELERILRPEPGDLLLRALYIHSLQSCLTGLLPDAQVVPFGSLVSGMWTKGGDLDLTVSFGERKQGRIGSRLRNILDDTYSHELLKLRKLLKSIDWQPGSHITAILQTRAPILRIDHACGLHVDLSMSESMNAHLGPTCMLIRAILEASVCPELRPLALFLKWQLRRYKRFPDQRLSGFKMTSLVMFFLQTRGLLPPLQPLMDDLASDRRLRAPSRTLRPEKLGELFRDLLIFLADLCGKPVPFFDLRTGNMGPKPADFAESRSVLICPEPNYPELDIMNVDKNTMNRLLTCCLNLSKSLSSPQPAVPAPVIESDLRSKKMKK